MKFLTGDDTGLLKLIRVEGKKIERVGERRRGEAIHRICWVGPADNPEAAVAIAYASGALELRSLSGQPLSSAASAEGVKCLQALNDEDGPRTPMREMRNDRILHRDRDLTRRKQNSEWADKSRVTGFHTH